MLSSITPLGERGKGNRWWVTVTAYLVGSAVGGAALGLLAGSSGLVVERLLPGGGALPDGAALWVLAAGCALAAVWDLAGRRPPSWHRQVDEQWLHAFRGWVYGFGFGVQLGFGLVTIVTSAATYAAVLAMVLTASPAAGALVGVVFGVARGLPILAARRVHDSDSLRRLHSRMDDRTRTARRTTVAALVTGGAAAAAAAVVATTGGLGA